MKTETKKRLLGGYFKNTSYNFQCGTPIDDYYNEKYGSGIVTPDFINKKVLNETIKGK